ncbi:MAG: toxic anion resistance protein [Patescibacteria group bacterium]
MVQTQIQPTQNTDLLAQQKTALAGGPPRLVTKDALSTDLGLIGPDAMRQAEQGKAVNPELQRQATEFVGKLLAIKVGDAQAEEDAALSVESVGTNVVRKASTANRLLSQPLKRLGQIGGGEGSGIADQLTDLKVQFDEIDPARYNFEAGWFGRLFGGLPLVGRPINKYFTKFESSGKVIESLFDSIETSKQELLRDIDTLRSEQVEMRTATKELQKLIITCQLIDAQLSEHVAALAPESDEAKYINTKLIYRLRQRITDLQQQLIVNQQGIIMFEVLVENNKELVRGVNRCKNVTYPALLIGVTAAQALAKQKIVLNKVQAVNQVGDRMIAFNANLLKTQGVEIHKLSASAQLSDQGLAQAMKDAIQALNDVETFRIKALDQMGTAIRERDNLTKQGEKAIRDMERGRKAAITLELDQEAELTGAKNA